MDVRADTVRDDTPLIGLHELVRRGRQLSGVHFEAEVVTQVDVSPHHLPVWVLTLGNPDRRHPAIGFFGGVHGIERIGASVVVAFAHHLLARAQWDRALQSMLERLRLVLMPVVNPGGLMLGTRCNPDGIDLMRNAPIDAEGRAHWLVGGQRSWPGLPWYRGTHGLANEAAALCNVVEREFAGRPLSVAVDCHSGFGMRDRVWFPHAGTRAPTRVLPEFHALTELFEDCHPHHPYRFEPQSSHYLAHGDLWDYLHRRIDGPDTPFLPMTLEMGSWLWVRKNLRQLLRRDGLFNPARGHRHSRVLRRHLPWLDFLLRATDSHARWVPVGEARKQHRRAALSRWYAGQSW